MRPYTIQSFMIFVATLHAGCTQQAEKPANATQISSPTKVAAAVAKFEPIARLLSVTGTLKANAESSVAANTAGQVVRTLVERGSHVKKGAVLVELDRRNAALAVAEARANLEGTRSQKELADNECERNRRLFNRHIITEQEFAKTSSSCEVQGQSLAAAKSKQQQATVVLSDATVRAPFDGVVSERFVNVGEYVTASTKIADIVQSDPVRLELTAGEGDTPAVHVGQTLRFEVKSAVGQTFTATVRYVAPALRAATRDLVFEAVAPNPDGILKPGSFATAWLETGTEQSVVVPSSALRKDGDSVHAFVIKDRHIEERIVHVEREIGDRTAIRTGVADGERLVQNATDALKDGLEVVE